jgi:hypothetical protein
MESLSSSSAQFCYAQLARSCHSHLRKHDGDADALKTAGDLVENQGMISSYSIGVWTNHLDMTLDTALDTSDAAIIAYQVCSELKIPLHRPWTVRFYLVDGHKVAECQIDR